MRYDQGDYSTIYDMFVIILSCAVDNRDYNCRFKYILLVCTFHMFTVYIHNKKNKIKQ